MKILAPLLSLLLLGACKSAENVASWGEVRQWGTLREALRDGRSEARVDVADVAGDGVYGVGALAELQGEITIEDGEVWVSEAAGGTPTTRRARGLAAPATVLFAAEVGSWRSIPVEAPVDPSELDLFVEEQAKKIGLDTKHPFPFVVEGELERLRLHVIAGQCPIRARMTGETVEQPAFETYVERVDGRLVGIHAPDSAGVVCHKGSNVHVHALLDGESALTGHVETVGIAAGSTLRVPAP